MDFGMFTYFHILVGTIAQPVSVSQARPQASLSAGEQVVPVELSKGSRTELSPGCGS